ncbi:hypothetical protein MAAFP003_5493 [Mycobacterium ahvazicum]|uniref:Uncharacterized protein n=1 Tax=Mycobacterium ahvazicum TaxID=1964395 RepID=A0A2K4YJ11_9MYCO|nr:hypothetical protein [Mycobacterium ahvazicum]SOX56782.1 hypothetical protein MAAFP003_5493 [Mycobacterium ahvazicum]
MLAIPKTPSLHRDTTAPTQARHSATPDPVLVTERQLMFATAAAVAGPHPRTAPRPWFTTLWQQLVRGVSVEHEPRRHYPPRRMSYFEQAATAREMDRL